MTKYEAVETGLNTYSVREDGCTIHSDMSKDKAEKTAQDLNSGKLVRVVNGWGTCPRTITKEEYSLWQEYDSHWYNTWDYISYNSNDSRSGYCPPIYWSDLK